MPIAKIALPDGRIARFEVAEGTTPEQVMAFANQHFSQPEAPNPTEGMSGTDKFMAGAGKAVTDIGRGLKQIAGPALRAGLPAEEKRKALEEEQASIDESKRLDAPLMKTGAGLAGNIAGGAAVMAPTMLIPGANTLVGSTLSGMAFGSLQPVSEGESRAKNTLFGGLGGAGGHWVGGKLANMATSRLARKSAEVASEKSANAVKDATLAEGRAAGYVVPPSEVKPNALSNLLERFAGKASVAQSASLKNQQVTNKLAREAIGLSPDTPITEQTLEPVKKAAWSVYDKIRNLGTLTADKDYATALNEIAKSGSSKLTPNQEITDLAARLSQKTLGADDVVEAIRNLRFEAKANLSPMSQNPVARRLGNAQLSAADALEGLIERNIAPSGLGQQLLKDFRNARISLAKVGTVERALTEGTGDVSAKKLASELAKGKPLSGELKTAAKFAQAFPKNVQQNVNPVPGGSPLDSVAAIGTSAATQNPAWLALALGRPAARSAVLSKMMASQPSYEVGAMTKIAPTLLDNNYQKFLARALAPSIYAAQE